MTAPQDFRPDAAPAPRWLAPFLWLLVAAAALVVFAPGLEGAFVYDDLRLVAQAPASQSIGAAFERFLEPLYAFEDPGADVQRGLWRPLTSATFSLGRTLGGGEPFAYHLISLLLHLTAAALLMRLSALLVRTRSGVGATRAELVAGVVGLIFAVHPAQVESVAWISAVNDPLWACFGLAALLAHERASLRGRTSIAAGFLTLAALLAKEHALVVPLLAIALDVTAGRRPKPFGLVALGSAVVLWYGLRIAAFGDADGGLFRKAGDYGLSATREWTLRLELMGGFVQNTALPLEPAVFRPLHPVRPADSSVLPEAAWINGWLLSIFFALRARRREVVAALVGFGLVVLPFVITPVTAGRFPLSDRYIYVAVGLLALGAAAALGRLRSPAPLVGLGLLAAVGCGWIARGHVPTFAGDIAFNVAAVEDAPKDPNVRWGASNAFFRSYARTRDVDDLMTAYIHCLNSLRAGQIYRDGTFEDDPDQPLNVRMGRLEALINDTPPEARKPDPTVFVTLDDRYQATLAQVGCLALLAEVTEDADLEYALQVATQAKRVWGEAAGLNFWSAWVHKKNGRLEEARAAAGRALAADPAHVDARGLLADVLSLTGDRRGAALLARENLNYAPGDVPRLVQHAGLAIDAGRLEEAQESVDRAIELSGGQDPSALIARASLEIVRRRGGNAVEWADRALRLDPENGYAHRARGQGLLLTQDFDEATSAFGEAARLIPDDYASHYQLGSLLLSARPGPDAAEEERRIWRETIVPILVRAYFLAPMRGTEQLAIQDVLEELIGGSADEAFNLGMGLKTQGREALSLYWMRRAVELSGEWSEQTRVRKLAIVHAELGLSYSKLGRFEEARAEFTAASRLNPDDFGIQFELANSAWALGDTYGALPHYRRALELFESSSVRPEMREAVRGSIVERMRQIESAEAAGPQPPPK